MKATRYFLLAASLLPASLMAQTAVDAMSISQSDLRGTARFMSMGGAFGALGGDLSTLTQNPAGLGIYRSSEVGISMDIDIMSAKGESSGNSTTMNQTKVYCPNFGYVGTWQTGSSIMPFFNWGVTYGRAKSFDRHYGGQINNLGSSLTNYVADFTSGEQWTNSELNGDGANPYMSTAAPWMSILMYNGCLINPTSNDTYQGLYGPGTSTTGYYNVEERGYVDEYSINFGGNFVNMVYWGLGIGIKDLSFDQWAYWSEDVDNGMVPYETNTGVDVAKGSGAYDLNSYKHIWGTGVDVKLGVILKPINELRLGLAVHTPTWYNLTQTGSADVSSQFRSTTTGVGGVAQTHDFKYTTWTNDGADDWFEWKFNTPWKLMVSAAGVIGKSGIISVDYEYQPYNQMSVKNRNGNDAGLGNVKEDIENYYQATSTIRIGGEYRVTPSFSLRAGYSYSSSPTKGESDVRSLVNAGLNMDTDGPDDTETTPSYVLNSDTQYITFGLGYRYQMFYIDAAYVYRTRSATYYPWSTSEATAKITQHDNNIVLTAGLKF